MVESKREETSACICSREGGSSRIKEVDVRGGSRLHQGAVGPASGKRKATPRRLKSVMRSENARTSPHYS